VRKQNSSFQTDFISEAGIDLTNNDYFAYVEYDKYACYVIADGLNEEPDPMSASLASQAVFLKFQEHPSMSRQTLGACLRAADKALCEAESRELLKASITVVITDFVNMRYGYLGNTRLRHYRKGFVINQSHDMSLANEDAKQQRLPEDTLAEHEERNNLYSYAGQGRGLAPTISQKIKLENGDVIALYTRGIWEVLEAKELDSIFVEAVDSPQETLKEVEKRILEKQPKQLENYTCAAIFVNKVFLDPNRKRTIKKIIIISIAAVLIMAILALAFCFFRYQRQKQLDELNRRYTNTIEYIQDSNFDTLAAQGDYERAEEKYLEAKNLATRVYFEAGRQDAMNSLDDLYVSRNETEQGDVAAAQSKASNEVSAASLVAEGDSAFAKGDYSTANVYYAMALEKYEELGDTAHAGLVQSKSESSSQKADAGILKEQEAEIYLQIGSDHEAAGEMLDAKKQYLFAKNIYRELQLDDKVAEVDGLLDLLEVSMAANKAKAEAESFAAEREAAAAQSEAAAQTEAAADDGKTAKNAIGPGVSTQ